MADLPSNLRRIELATFLESAWFKEDSRFAEAAALLRVAAETTAHPAVWRLTDEHINSLQVASIDRLIKRAKAAHYVNVRVRINGDWEEHEADWIKHMTREAAPAKCPGDGCPGCEACRAPGDVPPEQVKTSAPICPTCKTELAFEGDTCGLCVQESRT